MKKFFGTDGIRTVAGEYPLDPPTIFALGKALVELIQEEGLDPQILIGRDTRESGVWIEQVLFQGIQAGGGEAISAGVIPTSAVSFLTRKHNFSSGIVISASHNPYRDNGIKIFSSQGFKIPDTWELKLEKRLTEKKPPKRTLKKSPPIPFHADLIEDYEDFLIRQLDGLRMPKDLTIILDCSNGASSTVAPTVLAKLDFRVIAIFNAPDGKNINRRCGSLHPRNLAQYVVASRSGIGIAYDGDADRAIWVDDSGKILNGDHTLFVQSRFMAEKGRLKSNSVVATTMSNMGLEKALRDLGLALVRTRVGDKYVLEKMIELGANLGGEQSGHTIFLDDCPTGDGILTSLKMLEAMLASGSTLSELAKKLKEFPQVLMNVKVREKVDFQQYPEIVRVLDEIRGKLQGVGRLDVRYSGTEPLARVMIEGEEQAQIEELARRMTGVIAKYLGD